MFIKIFRMMVLLMFVLFVSGCFGGYSDDAGLDVEEMAFLDNDYETEIQVDKGDVFGLDAARPAKEGITLTGASFDPELFRMERYVEYQEDGALRVRYLFTALADGAGDVNLKMREAGDRAEAVFRTVRVVVGSDSGGLF